MGRRLRIGVIGDFQPGNSSQAATNLALDQAAVDLSVEVSYSWLSTRALEREVEAILPEYAGFWCAPGSPYQSLRGALRAIQWVREHDRPFLGT